MASQEELLQVQTDLTALQYATYPESPSGTALEEQMLSSMTSLRQAASSGNFSGLADQSATYRKLVLRREYLLSSNATAAMTQAAAQLQSRYDEETMVLLVTIAVLTLANNYFNNIVGTELDEYLLPYYKKDEQ